MKKLVLLMMLAASSAWASDVEKPSALNGSQYAVVAPVYDGSSGSTSFVRLFNGGTATSTFNVTVVNAANGLTLGAAAIQVPPNASPQFPLTSAGGDNSIFTQAGVGASGGNYALYLQNPDATAGYQHATFNGASGLFENNSVCATPIDMQLTAKQVLTNVHTTQLAGGAFPSNVGIHNYSVSAVTVTITAYDATNGNYIGQMNQAVAANSTTTLAESQIESSISFHPTSSQVHINLVVTNAAGGSVPVELTHVIHAASYSGDINMASACAMNAVAPTVLQVPATTPTAYCGTVSVFYYTFITANFNFSVATNGRIKGELFGQERQLHCWRLFYRRRDGKYIFHQ